MEPAVSFTRQGFPFGPSDVIPLDELSKASKGIARNGKAAVCILFE